MDENRTIPYIVFESTTARQERTIRRLWILCIILIVSLLGTNAGWIYYENQFTDTEVTQEVDTGEGSATVIGVGDYNGEGKTNGKDEN